MAEELFAYAFLMEAGLLPAENYWKKLDELFEAHMDDELLLELEYSARHGLRTVNLIREYMLDGRRPVDMGRFCRGLLGLLEEIYRRRTTALPEFGARAYLLGEALPERVSGQEPFLRLCWANDPLSYGDEAGAREIYEGIFSYDQEDSRGEPQAGGHIAGA